MKIIQKKLSSGKPLTWVFNGASIASGAYHTHGGRDYSQHFNERIRYEMKRPLDIVINSAFSGNTTADVLNSFERRVAGLKPDVLLLLVGMNDINPARGVSAQQFESNLDEIHQRCKAMDTTLVLQTNNPALPGAPSARVERYQQYMDVIRSVAGREELPLIDHAAIWQKEIDNLYNWMSDALHPNAHGHLFLAHTIFRAFGIFDPENSATCRLSYPVRNKAAAADQS